MIDRYSRPEMARIWSEQNRFQKWLEVEVLAAEALSRLGEVPKSAVARIKKRAGFDVDRIREIEKEVRHEVIAFLSSVAETLGDDARFLHVGLTSSDVMDTAMALQLKEAASLLMDDVRDLMRVLKQLAFLEGIMVQYQVPAPCPDVHLDTEFLRGFLQVLDRVYAVLYDDHARTIGIIFKLFASMAKIWNSK